MVFFKEGILERLKCEELYRLLLACDCKGRNTIHWAVRFNNILLLQTLLNLLPLDLQKKAINQPDTWGRSSIQWAFRLNYNHILALLMKHGGVFTQ